MVFPKDYDPGPAKTTGKRTAAGGATGGTTKKVKTEGTTDVDFREAAKRGNLQKLTVPVLKAFCKDNDLKGASQKKADLIKAINDHFSV